MRLLKLKAYQLLANYRKPMSYNFWDTYPLPPFSAVKGWFHRVVDATDYIPISICIQGNPSSIVYDLQTLIKFDRLRSEKAQTVIDGFNKALSKSPTFIANIFDIDLNIYLLSDNVYMRKFMENIFEKEFPHLGRYEDIIRIDSVNLIDVKEKEFSMFVDEHKIDYGIYLKRETANKLNIEGINYRMNFKYDIIDGLRYFSKVDIIYTDNAIINTGKFLFDSEDERIIELIGDL